MKFYLRRNRGVEGCSSATFPSICVFLFGSLNLQNKIQIQRTVGNLAELLNPGWVALNFKNLFQVDQGSRYGFFWYSKYLEKVLSPTKV